MLLFEHKLHLQSYNAQSLKQRKIFALTEIVFKDYTNYTNYTRVSDITKIDINPALGTHSMLRRRRAVVDTTTLLTEYAN